MLKTSRTVENSSNLVTSSYMIMQSSADSRDIDEGWARFEWVSDSLKYPY